MIDTKFADRYVYYDAFEAYHARNNLAPMEDLFRGYLNERLDFYRLKSET